MRVRSGIARYIASLVFSVSKKTRVRATNNLRIAYPNLSDDELTTRAKQSFQNIAIGLFDCFWLPQLKLNIVFNDDNAREIVCGGKSACIATLHTTCFELAPFAVQKITSRSTTLSKIPNFLPQVKKIYDDVGINCINKQDGNSALKLLSAIKRGQVVTVHSDHYAEEVDVDFFQRKTKAPSGIVSLASVTNSPLLIAYTIRESVGTYSIHFESVCTMSRSFNINELCQRLYSRFERIIRESPEQWYWSYNRWRKV